MGVKGIMRPPEFSITNRKHTLFLEFNCRRRPSKKGNLIKAFWPIAAGKGRLPICGIAAHSHWAAIPPDDVFSTFTIPAALGIQKNPFAMKLFLLFLKLFAKCSILLI